MNICLLCMYRHIIALHITVVQLHTHFRCRLVSIVRWALLSYTWKIKNRKKGKLNPSSPIPCKTQNFKWEGTRLFVCIPVIQMTRGALSGLCRACSCVRVFVLVKYFCANERGCVTGWMRMWGCVTGWTRMCNRIWTRMCNRMNEDVWQDMSEDVWQDMSEDV